MNKELLKGLALLVGAIVAVGTVFVMASHSGPQKANCIARALKSGVAYGKIGKVCQLGERSH